MHELSLPRRPLGATGIEVSCLGLGTVKFGRNEGVKYPNGFKLPDDMDVTQILALARELGINLIDTAPAYGSSEERLGKLLPNRHEWVLCSKVGEEFDKGVSWHDFSAAHVRRSIERSLGRLRTDYLDLVLIHSDGNDEHILRETDCLAELMRCREAGLIRALGMSTKTVAGGLLALAHADVVMVTYNPLETAEVAVIEEAQRLKRGVLIKKALNSGHVLAGPTEGDAHEGAGLTRDPVQRSMEFIFRQPGVSAIIIGTINPLHIRHNAGAATAALRARG